MRLFLAISGIVALTLLAGANYNTAPGGTVIRLSDPKYATPKWITVPAPTTAPGPGGARINQGAVGWITAAGTRTFQYALVDEQTNISPWSPPLSLDFLQGQGTIIDYDDFVPAWPEAVAIIWKTGSGPALAAGGAAYATGNHLYYFNPLNSGRSHQLQEDWGPYLGNIQNRPASTIITTQPPIAKIDKYDVPNIDLEICYAEVSHTGDTALSPSRVSAKTTAMPEAGATYRQINWYDHWVPYGSLGRHVYARPVGTTTWYRQPNSQCFGNPTGPDDYLWRHEGGSVLYHYRTDVPYNPPAEAKSEACSLLQARMDATKQGQVILVDIPATMDDYGRSVVQIKTKTPIYDRYAPANGEQGLQVMGEYGVQWSLVQDNNPPAGCVDQGKNWPVLLVSNQKSKWKDMTVQANKGWSALAYYDFSGGQAFGNEFHACSFKGYDRAMSMTYQSGAAGHTPSEQMFNGCSFNARVAVEITGNQTANIRINGPTYVFSNNTNRGAIAFKLDTPNPLRFLGDTYFDGGFKAIEQGETTYGDTTFEYVWCDQGYPVFFDSVAMVRQSISIKGGKLNSWNSYGGKKPFLARQAASVQPFNLNFEGVQMQHNFGVDGHLKVYSPVYQAFRARFTNSDQLYKGMTVTEPTWEQQVALGFKLPQFGSNIAGVWTWSQPPMPKISKTINVE